MFVVTSAVSWCFFFSFSSFYTVVWFWSPAPLLPASLSCLSFSRPSSALKNDTSGIRNHRPYNFPPFHPPPKLFSLVNVPRVLCLCLPAAPWPARGNRPMLPLPLQLLLYCILLGSPPFIAFPLSLSLVLAVVILPLSPRGLRHEKNASKEREGSSNNAHASLKNGHTTTGGMTLTKCPSASLRALPAFTHIGLFPHIVLSSSSHRTCMHIDLRGYRAI